MRTQRHFHVTSLLAAFAFAGCASSMADGDLDGEIAEDGKNDGDSAVIGPGTYTAIDLFSITPIEQFTLLADRRFHRSFECPGCAPDGTYKLTRYREKRFIRFYRDDGELMDRYVYEVQPDLSVIVQLYEDHNELGWNGAGTYVRDDAGGWCSVAGDCAAQGLDPDIEWSCEVAACVPPEAP